MYKRYISFSMILIVMCSFSSIVYGEKCAIFFFEYNHEDTDTQDEDEVSAITFSNEYLKSYYDQFYWLVNTDATKDNFTEILEEAFNNYTIVDIFIHAHGGMQFFRGHFDDRITVDDILSYQSFENIGHLRLVYMGTCHGFDTTDEFVDIGADVGVGSDTKIVNFPFYPLFLYHFAKRGQTVGVSCLLSDIMPDENFRVNGDKTIRMTQE